MINRSFFSVCGIVVALSLGLSACNSEEQTSALDTLNTQNYLGGNTSDSSNEFVVMNPVIETTGQSDSANDSEATDELETSSKLDSAEQHHLIFMREEEKLARDVYASLASMWPDSRVFVNIGEGSEQTHMDIIRDKLVDYGMDDPDPEANSLPSSIGVFTGEVYGAYFFDKYQLLINKGSQSELDALYVGAFIEELDMHDIVECPKVIVDTDNGITNCGLNYTDEKPLIIAYSSLLDGSKNHLRSFVGRIENIIGAGNYAAQVITQDEVNDILGR